MDELSALSEKLAALAARASRTLYHVPSDAGGRTALGFGGSLLLVPAYSADEGDELELLAPGGAKVKAKVKGFDPARGFAALELESPLGDAAWTPMRDMPALGSLVLAAAYPSPEGPEVRLDAIRFSGGSGDEAYIQTDGQAFPGFAGGALVAPSGELAGVIATEWPGNAGYAIPAARARALVEQIAQRGFPGRAWLGVSTIPVEGESGGLLVASLEEGGPAAKAGILVGDILLAAGGVALSRPRDLREALARALPGEPLALDLLRGGQRIAVGAVPGRAPAGEGHRRGPFGPGFMGPWARGFRGELRGGCCDGEGRRRDRDDDADCCGGHGHHRGTHHGHHGHRGRDGD